jgi:predicted amidohydrolase
LNAVYCVANSVGFDGERGYPGNSWIISTNGEVVAHLPGTAIIEAMREGIAVATV